MHTVDKSFIAASIPKQKSYSPKNGGTAQYPAITDKHKAMDCSYTYSAIECLARARH